MLANLLLCALMIFLGGVLLEAFLGYWLTRNAPAVFGQAPKPDPFVRGGGFSWVLHFLSTNKRQAIPSVAWRIVALISALAIVASLSLAFFAFLHFAASGGTF